MLNVAFVMEQALGHITVTKNLRRALESDPEIRPSWSLIEFAATGLGRRVPVFRSNWTVRAGVRARRRLTRLARSTTLDAVYFHTQVPAVLSRRWLRRLPSVVSIDATPAQYDRLGAAYGHYPGPAWLERVKWRANRDCFHAATRLVAFSDWAKQGLVEDYQVPEAKVSVIRPGVDLDRWRFVDRRGRQGRGALKILFVGGDFTRKGGPLLLRAFELLRDLDVELHIVTRRPVPVGPGCFVHTGLQPVSPELIALFEEADVFCLPTNGDALAMAFCEAGATGLPAVATDVGAVTEAVLADETGLVVPRDDLAALVAALRRLLQDEDLRLRYGRAARAHVEREFNLTVNGSRVIEICKDVVAARR